MKLDVYITDYGVINNFPDTVAQLMRPLFERLDMRFSENKQKVATARDVETMLNIMAREAYASGHDMDAVEKALHCLYGPVVAEVGRGSH
ncbi:hypothetical protein [Litorivivens sp.]|uniref:hypothetical protein n=1 Tax=Litorivivens sp. TaxID=2020868 RepID=UPI003565382F